MKSKICGLCIECGANHVKLTLGEQLLVVQADQSASEQGAHSPMIINGIMIVCVLQVVPGPAFLRIPANRSNQGGRNSGYRESWQ